MTHPPDLANLRPAHRQAPFTTARVILALILREMTTTYGRTPGGYAWAVLGPLAAIGLLTWAFTLMLREPPLGISFAMFYATGWMPFSAFSAVSQRTSQALSYSRQLLAYPRVTILDAVLARFLLNLLVQLLVACLILAGVRVFQETGTTLLLLQVLLGYAMAAALAAGVGMLNCYLFARFPLWANLWSILTRPLLLISGVLILVEELPEPWSGYLTWNPLAHVVAMVRSGFYYGYHPDFVSPAYVFGVALVTGSAGLLFLWRYHRDVRER